MKNIKPVLQNDFKDCGVCCMQWLFIYYDGYISLEKLRDDTYTNINGTNAYHIVSAFKKWGFDSSGVLEHDIQSKNLKFPFIAHLRLKNGFEHFVVVKNVYKDTVYLMDPGIGNKKMTLTEFNEVFSGNIILAYPRSNIIKMNKELSISKLFLNIIKKEKFLIVKIIITSLIWTILSIIGSYYLKIGSGFLTFNSHIFKYLVIIFGIFTLSKIFMYYIRTYYENHLSNIVDVYLYPEFLKHIFSLPLKSIKSRTTGEIITRVDELANIKSLFSDIFVSGFLDTLMMLISIVILFVINSKLFLILFIFIAIYAIYGFIISKILYKKVLENINYQTDFNSILVENITMLESIKNLNIGKIILDKIEKYLSKFLFNNYQFNSFFNITNLGKDFLLESCFFLINSFGLWYILKGDLNVVNLFTFNIILSYFVEPVKNIINLLPKYNYIKATYTKITEFINIEEEKLEEDYIELDGEITFKNVSYSYNNYDYILKNLNFKISKGTHALLNGLSGSGKSTICKLLYKENLNFLGDIYLDGKNIKDINMKTIRENILYVSQNEELFTGTILENILVGRKVSEEYLNNVCKICELEKIVSKKPLRYNSLIEANSKNISGGEKQRIILARGLIKNANIIILDEALSEVDKTLESIIIKNIKEYFHDKTIIYISHKNQTKNFQNIIELGRCNHEFSN